MSIDTRLARIQTLLRLERELLPINSLENLADSQRHRKTIHELWQAVQTELQSISRAIKELPDLPSIEQIQWAQAVLSMRDLVFLEIDTTGLDSENEMVRFVLMDLDERVKEDFFIKPTAGCQLSPEASRINGLTPEILEAKGVGKAEAWERIQAALWGKYILSYAQAWDRKQLDAMAERYQLEPIVFIGEDLQRHCTEYYHGEYYLSLAKLAQRVGYELPEPPEQTAIHRAIAQCRITRAMANAVTDLRPSTDSQEGASCEDETDELESSLDDHPF